VSRGDPLGNQGTTPSVAAPTPPPHGGRPLWERVLLVVLGVLGGLAAATVASIAFAAFTYFLPMQAEEVDWSTQPLEVVVGGPAGACSLSLDAVAPGVHEVVVIAEASTSRVVIRDPSGRVLFRAEEEADGAAGPNIPSARLGLGNHRVTCSSDEGIRGTAQLRVVPAGELG
jgi:hypothetical protein